MCALMFVSGEGDGEELRPKVDGPLLVAGDEGFGDLLIPAISGVFGGVALSRDL